MLNISGYKALQAGVVVAIASVILRYLLGSSLSGQSHMRVAIHGQSLSISCNELASTLPGKVFFSDKPLLASASSYWSRQEEELTPQCVVRLTDVDDVSKAIQTINKVFTQNGTDEALFAIRSGGHAPHAGGANVDGGVTLDLSLISQVTVADDSLSTTVGTGARWANVYEKLDHLGLAVVGGRNADVGVGGLLLGGGLSFFSPRAGFASDNILNFETVLSNGTVINASESSHSDLWVALKGGSNNFGVVTKFTLRTFAQGKVWAGYVYSPISTAPQQLDAFYRFTQPEGFDEHASSILAFGYQSKYGIQGVGHNIQYTKPQNTPACFKSFLSIKRWWTTTKIKTLSAATKEIAANSPPGFRQYFRTTTFESNLDFLHTTYDLMKGTIDGVKPAKGIIWSFVYQSLPSAVTTKSTQNPLGLPNNATLIVALITASWKYEKDDELVMGQSKTLLDRIDLLAAERGLANRYRYLNYAHGDQDPIAGYGSDSQRSMQEVSNRYNPQGLFQKACSGSFKLSMTA